MKYDLYQFSVMHFKQIISTTSKTNTRLEKPAAEEQNLL